MPRTGAVSVVGGDEAPTAPDLSEVRFQALPTYPAGSAFDERDFFPLGVWLESVTEPVELTTDQQAGLNTYVGLTANSDLALATSGGAPVILQQNEWLTRRVDPAAWLLDDEPDMRLDPAAGVAHLTQVSSQLPEGAVRYTNFGKGVAFWNTPEQAARYVNSLLDFVSVDTYWFTDQNICAPSEGGGWYGGVQLTDCHVAYRYGDTVRHVRRLDARDGVRIPVWNMVETGHPFSENDWPSIQPAQIRSAVWHSLIAGAQGIVYFNHSFGGPCPSQHVLREPCYAEQRAVVTALNAQITRLASVLNQPTLRGFVRARQVRTLVKQDSQGWYVFAASDGTAGRVTFAVAGGDRAEVVDENRTLPVVDGVFTDTFAESDAVHIYRIPRQ